ncbi:MAG: flagellar motor protein MotB, partial [Sphingomonas sp.]
GAAGAGGVVGFWGWGQPRGGRAGPRPARGVGGGGGAAPRPAPAATPDPMPVAAAAMLDFAPGSSLLPHSPTGLVAWARDAASDPRVMLKVTGETDGSAQDVDPATGSAAVLAADRARTVAAALAAAHVVAPGRLTIVNAADRPGHGRRAVFITIAFAGNRQ